MAWNRSPVRPVPGLDRLLRRGDAYREASLRECNLDFGKNPVISMRSTDVVRWIPNTYMFWRFFVVNNLVV